MLMQEKQNTPKAMGAIIRRLADCIEHGTIIPAKEIEGDAYRAAFKAELPEILNQIADHLDSE